MFDFSSLMNFQGGGGMPNLFGGGSGSPIPNLFSQGSDEEEQKPQQEEAQPSVEAQAPAQPNMEAETQNKQAVASTLAQNRAEDAKSDKYTNMIPFAGPFITLARQNDRKMGALLSSYYMMTNPSGPSTDHSVVISPMPNGGAVSFLGRR